MSRLYDFQVEAELPEGIDHRAAKKALADYDSGFTVSWWRKGRLLSGGGNVTLCAGTTPDEAADEIARALWTAANACFEVKVSYVCLEDLPWETEIRDADDFERLMLDHPAA
jgi:hypothetical protein